MTNPQRVLIWDLPTRVFHWLLVAGFATAAFVALVLGDDSPLFPYHAIVGLTIALMVGLRVAWGFFGSRHARFSSFAFGPRTVIAYLRGLVQGRGVRHAGHNPGAAWAIFAMLGILLGSATTGLLLGQGNESVEEIHEVLAYTMLAVVALHILGVVLHTVRHRENITASMIHGRKNVEAQAGIASSYPIVALTFGILAAAWAGGLLANYNAATRTTRLPLLGVSVQIGEVEGEGQPEDGEEHDEDD